jgi:hypothetical protein
MKQPDSHKYHGWVEQLQMYHEVVIKLSGILKDPKVSTWEEKNAPYYFRNIVLSIHSILRILPGSIYYSSEDILSFFDIGAVGLLTRSLIDRVLNYHYFIFEKPGPDIQKTRQLLSEYYFSKYVYSIEKGLIVPEKFNEYSGDIEPFRKDRNYFKSELKQNKHFQSLSPEKRDAAYLTGMLDDHYAIASTMKINKKLYKSYYDLFSQYIHGGPIAINNIKFLNVNNEKFYYAINRILEYGTNYILLAINYHIKVLTIKNVEDHLPPYFEKHLKHCKSDLGIIEKSKE